MTYASGYKNLQQMITQILSLSACNNKHMLLTLVSYKDPCPCEEQGCMLLNAHAHLGELGLVSSKLPNQVMPKFVIDRAPL